MTENWITESFPANLLFREKCSSFWYGSCAMSSCPSSRGRISQSLFDIVVDFDKRICVAYPRFPGLIDIFFTVVYTLRSFGGYFFNAVYARTWPRHPRVMCIPMRPVFSVPASHSEGNTIFIYGPLCLWRWPPSLVRKFEAMANHIYVNFYNNIYGTSLSQ